MFGLKYCDSSNNLKTIKSGKDVLKYLITSKTVNENNSDIDLVFEAADK
jgi:hypothetical protein